MLHVYAVKWCPHCQKTIEFLKRNGIDFEYTDMDSAGAEVEKKISEINGGEWCVPTLENNGKWRPGEPYNEKKLTEDLKQLGVDVPC